MGKLTKKAIFAYLSASAQTDAVISYLVSCFIGNTGVFVWADKVLSSTTPKIPYEIQYKCYVSYELPAALAARTIR